MEIICPKCQGTRWQYLKEIPVSLCDRCQGTGVSTWRIWDPMYLLPKNVRTVLSGDRVSSTKGE